MNAVVAAGTNRPEVLAPEFAWRTLRLLNAFRMLATAFLFALFLYPADAPLVGAERPELFFAAVLSSFIFAALNDFAVNQHWPSVPGQCLAQAAVDVLVVAAMAHASGGLDSGIGNLLFVTIGGISFVSTRYRALGLASFAALALIAVQAYEVLHGDSPTLAFRHAGLLGGLLMVMAFAAAPLARRIHENEALARQRGVDLENLNQLNEYIIQNLRESIVVVDTDDCVRLMNEAAAEYLGVGQRWRGARLGEVSERLAQHARAWRAGGERATLSSPFPSADGSTLISPYFVPIGDPGTGALLVFLEDLSVISERVQQSKLAALGRLSASIAHEIRNPVGAMSHAAQLLEESGSLDDTGRRLTTIIEGNARRVSNIVESVQQLSRREEVNAERIDLVSWAAQFVEEFTGSREMPRAAIKLVVEEAPIEVRMDAGHLHQVLTNLCENALKYAQMEGLPTVELVLGRRTGTGRPFLEVRDRGPGIPTGMVERIFEPFFRASPDRGGSGLGLFISRELCECNRAALLYEPREGGGSVFRIIFADPQRWEVQA